MAKSKAHRADRHLQKEEDDAATQALDDTFRQLVAGPALGALVRAKGVKACVSIPARCTCAVLSIPARASPWAHPTCMHDIRAGLPCTAAAPVLLRVEKAPMTACSASCDDSLTGSVHMIGHEDIAHRSWA